MATSARPIARKPLVKSDSRHSPTCPTEDGGKNKTIISFPPPPFSRFADSATLEELLQEAKGQSKAPANYYLWSFLIAEAKRRHPLRADNAHTTFSPAEVDWLYENQLAASLHALINTGPAKRNVVIHELQPKLVQKRIALPGDVPALWRGDAFEVSHLVSADHHSSRFFLVEIHNDASRPNIENALIRLVNSAAKRAAPTARRKERNDVLFNVLIVRAHSDRFATTPAFWEELEAAGLRKEMPREMPQRMLRDAVSYITKLARELATLARNPEMRQINSKRRRPRLLEK